MSATRGSVRSQLSQPPITGSALRWELQAKDIHMGIVARNDARIT